MRRVGLLVVAFSARRCSSQELASSPPEGRRRPETAITPSPAYTADQLNAPAGNNWLTHMGNLNGTRYSSLTQITQANVGHPQGGVAHQPRHVRDEGRGVRLARGERGRRRRHLLLPDAEERRLRARRDDRRDSSGTYDAATCVPTGCDPASTSAPAGASRASRSARARSSPARVTATSSRSTR